MSWDRPDPFVIELAVVSEQIDVLGHVNNAVYVQWLEQAAWQHSASLGLDLGCYRQLDRAMAVRRHEIDYLASARMGDRLQLATWIAGSDRRLKITRQFQLLRPADGCTLLQASTTFVCVELSTGRPRRMPAAFVEGYGRALVV